MSQMSNEQIAEKLGNRIFALETNLKTLKRRVVTVLGAGFVPYSIQQIFDVIQDANIENLKLLKKEILENAD